MTTSGCTGLTSIRRTLDYSDCMNEFMIGYRNRGMATKAWHRRKNQFCREKYLDDFCAGFTAGYMAVADGEDGCTPAFPPRSYWSWQYQSAEGQGKVSSWFAGFPHGARAAEEDGLGNWSQIQTSSTSRAEYLQAGLLTNETMGLYPIAQPAGQIPMAQPIGVPMGEPMNAMPIQAAPIVIP